MRRSKRVSRPYVRQRRSLEDRAGGAGRLALSAGLTDRPTVEQLERRQMLFALTVTADDVDPATGLGTVQQAFTYYIPYLFPSVERQEVEDEDLIEDFNDEAPGLIGNGAFFLESGVQVLHNIAPAANIRIEPPDPDIQEKYLRVDFSATGQQFTFVLWNDATNPTRTRIANIVSFDVVPDAGSGSPVGLNPDTTIVDLLLGGEITASFTGDALRAAIQGNPALGTGTFTFDVAGETAFDRVRVRTTSGAAPAFQLDNLTFNIPRNEFIQLLDSRRFGAIATLTGPVGATAQFFDLYGAPLISVPSVTLDDFTNYDLNADGIPDSNEGIGSIRFSGVDGRTNFSLIGAAVTQEEDPGDDVDFVIPAFGTNVSFLLEPEAIGYFDAFEAAGFGYIATGVGEIGVNGLPTGPGSVIIGSPYIRDRSSVGSYNAFGFPSDVQGIIVTEGFVREDQGLFITDGSSMGGINIFGIVHGSSRFDGYVDRLNIGYMLGSVTVEGDLGYISSGTDAGQWTPDPDPDIPPGITIEEVYKTDAQLVVGRTLGEFLVAGRSLVDITVIGDLNSPTTRPARDFYNYYEKEAVLGINPTITRLGATRTVINGRAGYTIRQPGDLYRPLEQPFVFGNTYFRNDALLSAEWIGGNTTGVRIKGELSGRDPFNGADDSSDAYAFAVDGTTEIVIEGSAAGTVTPYYRIMDKDGRVLAAPEFPFGEGRFQTSQLRWTPDSPGIYFLVVSDPNGADPGFATVSYSMSVIGIAPTTFGQYRTGAASGQIDLVRNVGNSVTLLSGDMGAVRVGTAFTDGSGAEADPAEITNYQDGDDENLTDNLMSFWGGTFTIPGRLYNITSGSDIGAPTTSFGGNDITFNIGGDLGSVHTGRSLQLAADGGGDGAGGRQGDLNFIRFNVGGRIGTMDIGGGVGLDQDPADSNRRSITIPDSVVIRTGLNGGNGDIGWIRTGFHIAGDNMRIVTSPGSTIGAFLVSQDAYFDADPRVGVFQGAIGVPVTVGLGSDVRFVDLPQIDLQSGIDASFPLIAGQTLQLTDDAGSVVSFSISGAVGGTTVGFVRALPINNSRGVAIAQVEVNLVGSRTLTINSTNPNNAGVVSIGRILVTGGDATSGIVINGNTEVDVWQIQQTGGTLGSIANNTIGGDIVAIDVPALNTFSINGDLGRTQVPTFGPKTIGPWLGIATGGSGEVGGALGITVGDAGGGFGFGPWDDDYNGNPLRPVQSDDFAAGNAFLDDIGAPFDGYLNGLAVRSGNMQSVTSTGALGDVLLLGEGAVLTSVIANSDLITAPGRFDGIVGTIFATDINRVVVGDGLQKPDPSPYASSGIFAVDDIVSLETSVPNAIISGPIVSNNAVDPDLTLPAQDGLNSITLTNARVVDAFFGTTSLDGFWLGFNYADDNLVNGPITNMRLQNTNIFRSEIRGRSLGTLDITGIYDATTVLIARDIGTIRATEFRNSTLGGEQFEVRTNSITGGGNLQTLTATNEMADLTVDIIGDVTSTITAVNISRSRLEIDGRVAGVSTTQSIRGSTINAGLLPNVTAGADIRSSSIRAAGQITSITATNVIAATIIESTGPDGRIDTISAPNLISGSIAVSGPIGTIRSLNGDVNATITTTGPRGTVGTVSAGRDLAIEVDASQTVSNLTAGRHIGRIDDRGVILVRGDLAQVNIPNGQLYSDLRVGGNITGAITIGSAIAKPFDNQVGRGSIVSFNRINTVTINGDFGGSIVSYTGGLGTIAINNGSFLAGGSIAAYTGSIDSVVITNGNLYGNVHADFNLTSLRVVAGADGVFGDIGTNPNFSQGVFYDARRNQLPPGVAPGTAVQGPLISAGQSIVNVQVTNGSIFETGFFAGRTIGTISVIGDVLNDISTSGIGSFFAAGDTITAITVSGAIANTQILAGVKTLGADNRPGGTGANRDIVKSGNVVSVTAASMVDSKVTAGMDAGADGVYNTFDDRQALGVSVVTTLAVAGPVTNTTVFADSFSPAVAGDARFIKGGSDAASVDPLIDSGVGIPGIEFTGARSFTVGGVTYGFTVTGPGQAFFNDATRTLTLRNTTIATTVAVTSSNGLLENLNIVTNDDAALASLTVTPAMVGTSTIVVDAGVGALNLGHVDTAGRITIGGDVTTATFSTFFGGSLSARNAGTLRINGAFGVSTAFGEVRIDLLSAGAITVVGEAAGLINVERSATSLALGSSERSQFRFGDSLGTLTSGRFSRTILSVRNSLGPVTVTGDMFDSAILAGGDLGSDATYGGSGLAADEVTTGFITSVNVTGSFRESDIVVGYVRGADAFYGTGDDKIAPGRGSLGPVTIGGVLTGSSRNTESYRIASNGSIGVVRANGQNVNTALGNFAIEAPRLAPAALRVTDISVRSDAGAYEATITFNQPYDVSTISQALSVSEVRGTAAITTRLIEGIDYTLRYTPDPNTVVVVFSTAITRANLPQVPGRPGPGVYRFEFDQDFIRAKLQGIRLDGDGDGLAENGDDFRGHAIVGDAGDRLSPTVVTVGSGASARQLDLYGGIELDRVLDDPNSPNGLPRTNTPFIINGTIGDHPDHDVNLFRFASDTDVYFITLQAGQILRLGPLSGGANRIQRLIVDPAGNIVGAFAQSPAIIPLPGPTLVEGEVTVGDAFLVKQTGRYAIVLGNEPLQADDLDSVINVPPVPGGTGDYAFSVEVFDDGDSGFTADVDSGNGAAVVTPPAPIDFAGPDGLFGTADDPAVLNIGAFNFTYSVGPDGIANTADDVVTGDNNRGVVATRINNQITTTISAAIGPEGHAGVPGDVTSDVDIFHLNNRAPITPGTKLKITVKLSALGADLGGFNPVTLEDFRGSVQMGFFETTNSVNVEDGVMVFSPSDFQSTAGRPNTVIADNGVNRYGFDANGDFFIEFVVPSSLGAPEGTPGTFAVYVQGVFNTDYQLEIVQGGTGSLAPQRQNIFIETNGGVLDWLERGGLLSEIEGFSARVLGFQGLVANGQNADTYILTNLVAALNGLFSQYNVVFSTNSADFEFQPFSTVYLTSSADPISPIFRAFEGLNFGFFSQNFVSTQPYGFSEHADPFNTDLEDEAVVFVPSFSLQGLTPSRADVDEFVESLTAAVSRRAGELMGLRITDAYTPGTTFDPFAANSPNARPTPGQAYSVPGFGRALSSTLDTVDRTNFFLGQQNAATLLDRVLGRI